MKSVLFDTNIILDIALKRTAHFEMAQKLFDLIDSNLISAYVSATTITDIYFISRKNIGREKAIEFITHLIEVIDIASVDREIIVKRA